MAVPAPQQQVMKRSYLTICRGPLKDSMLSSRRWCVLLLDASRGHIHTRMDFFKDEKTASRGEEPRNSLSVSSIVEAQRATEKKQTFDLLCPGVSHRFQASSEAEADDWVAAVKNLIVYRKDVHHSSPTSLTLPMLSVHSQPHHCFPTLTDNAVTSTPIPVSPERRPVPQTSLSSSMEAAAQNPFPSPNSSSDSSSLHSASTGSVEGHNRPALVAAEPAPEQRLANGRYRVRLKDCDQLAVAGECDLAVEDDCITLYRPGQNVQVASWHIGTLRRYGVNKVCFTIDVGRHSPTGEGKFYFYTSLSSVIYSEVHRIAQRIDALSKGAMLSSSPRKESDTLSTFTSVSACIPSAGYSRLNHHPSSVVSAPGSAGHTYGMISHDGNHGGSTFDNSHGNSVYNRQSLNRGGGSQLGYESSNPLPLPPRSAVSHTLPYVRSSSSPGNSTSYLMHRYHSSSSESETAQSSHQQQGDVSSSIAEEELPPPLPPKPQRSMSADAGGPVYMNSGVLPVPPRTRIAAETNTVL